MKQSLGLSWSFLQAACKTHPLKTLTSLASLLDAPHLPVRIPEEHSNHGGFPAEGQASATKPIIEETIPLLQN